MQYPAVSSPADQMSNGKISIILLFEQNPTFVLFLCCFFCFVFQFAKFQRGRELPFVDPLECDFKFLQRMKDFFFFFNALVILSQSTTEVKSTTPIVQKRRQRESQQAGFTSKSAPRGPIGSHLTGGARCANVALTSDL